jgi:hypothetical protein
VIIDKNGILFRVRVRVYGLHWLKLLKLIRVYGLHELG